MLEMQMAETCNGEQFLKFESKVNFCDIKDRPQAPLQPHYRPCNTENDETCPRPLLDGDGCPSNVHCSTNVSDGPVTSGDGPVTSTETHVECKSKPDKM